MKADELDIGLHSFYVNFFNFKENGQGNLYSDFKGLARLIEDLQLSSNYDVSRMSLGNRVAFALSMSIIGNNLFSSYNVVHSFRVGRIMFDYSNLVNSFYGLELVNPLVAKTGGYYHDIGHTISPESILLREGDVNDEERKILKRHTEYGEMILKLLEVDEQMILDCAKYHHEKFNGEGYYGISGEMIPFISRMVNIVDVYDAIRGRRAYKAPVSQEMASDKMKKDFVDQKCFDPELFVIFIKNIEKFEYLYEVSNLYENIVMLPN